MTFFADGRVSLHRMARRQKELPIRVSMSDPPAGQIIVQSPGQIADKLV